MDELWQMLGEPFPPEDLSWRVEAVSKDGKRVLLARCVDVQAVLDRLDEVLGPQGWQDHYELLQVPGVGGRYAVKCRLTIQGVSKEDVGEGESLQAAFADALRQAALKFGVGRFLAGERRWVDRELEGAPQTLPEGASGPSSEKLEPQVLIDRLLERLKQAGLGRQAAQIVVKYGGYGKHPEETRRLYGELRALLKGSTS
ncbi:MAG: Rad52/Rad22 family DNA repair protein [Meiothermus sp.]|uniref:Rad52/Rad22 family DNA repair protein n=1 Tax=Meiothermus sp. TaxID=1955249 RepID=UPI0025F26BCC|nr:Rad52/Rad22 family DNA repair protein [Meiothermus sp.]MCS7059458.1 Rad52/Rad22 family DNA repair protein [Meiothermus sp.]MCS7193878.1 Rad52/Rad22 family DNA repair protein [Meiothermus sp.]MCX7739906.1 Rad52/Rad22 family DNA repair protein [Meiothermus sp.]MDW8090176.1 Rad52/Rad22 family DNA repair protein [Meiothermus sp.]MDW8481478.1 Rad52/Rad22 family DNA repair protein [Meiothermus sp.]